VYLSTIGAQASRSNLLSQHTIIEQELRKLALPITFLRPGWFMENSAWDVAPAKNGVIPCFLQPLDRPAPMVATSDVGRVAAELFQEPRTATVRSSWRGRIAYPPMKLPPRLRCYSVAL
jgi:NAD(P)H dehydrogenase (quinone)